MTLTNSMPIYGAVSRQLEASGTTQQAISGSDSPAEGTSGRKIGDEIRASLAGSVRSHQINEAYIETLKARAEERAAMSRASGNRSRIGGLAAAAALPTDTDNAGAEIADRMMNSRVSGSLAAAQTAYRSHNG